MTGKSTSTKCEGEIAKRLGSYSMFPVEFRIALSKERGKRFREADYTVRVTVARCSTCGVELQPKTNSKGFYPNSLNRHRNSNKCKSQSSCTSNCSLTSDSSSLSCGLHDSEHSGGQARQGWFECSLCGAYCLNTNDARGHFTKRCDAKHSKEDIHGCWIRKDGNPVDDTRAAHAKKLLQIAKDIMLGLDPNTSCSVASREQTDKSNLRQHIDTSSSGDEGWISTNNSPSSDMFVSSPSAGDYESNDLYSLLQSDSPSESQHNFTLGTEVHMDQINPYFTDNTLEAPNKRRRTESPDVEFGFFAELFRDSIEPHCDFIRKEQSLKSSAPPGYLCTSHYDGTEVGIGEEVSVSFTVPKTPYRNNLALACVSPTTGVQLLQESILISEGSSPDSTNVQFHIQIQGNVDEDLYGFWRLGAQSQGHLIHVGPMLWVHFVAVISTVPQQEPGQLQLSGSESDRDDSSGSPSSDNSPSHDDTHGPSSDDNYSSDDISSNHCISHGCPGNPNCANLGIVPDSISSSLGIVDTKEISRVSKEHLHVRRDVHAQQDEQLQVQHGVHSQQEEQLQVQHGVHAQQDEQLQVQHGVHAQQDEQLQVQHGVRSPQDERLQVQHDVQHDSQQGMQHGVHSQQREQLQVQYGVHSQQGEPLQVQDDIQHDSQQRLVQLQHGAHTPQEEQLQVQHSVHSQQEEQLQVRHGVRSPQDERLQVQHDVQHDSQQGMQHGVHSEQGEQLQVQHGVHSEQGEQLQVQHDVQRESQQGPVEVQHSGNSQQGEKLQVQDDVQHDSQQGPVEVQHGVPSPQGERLQAQHGVQHDSQQGPVEVQHSGNSPQEEQLQVQHGSHSQQDEQLQVQHEVQHDSQQGHVEVQHGVHSPQGEQLQVQHGVHSQQDEQIQVQHGVRAQQEEELRMQHDVQHDSQQGPVEVQHGVHSPQEEQLQVQNDVQHDSQQGPVEVQHSVHSPQEEQLQVQHGVCSPQDEQLQVQHDVQRESQQGPVEVQHGVHSQQDEQLEVQHHVQRESQQGPVEVQHGVHSQQEEQLQVQHGVHSQQDEQIQVQHDVQQGPVQLQHGVHCPRGEQFQVQHDVQHDSQQGMQHGVHSPQGEQLQVQHDVQHDSQQGPVEVQHGVHSQQEELLQVQHNVRCQQDVQHDSKQEQQLQEVKKVSSPLQLQPSRDVNHGTLKLLGEVVQQANEPKRLDELRNYDHKNTRQWIFDVVEAWENDLKGQNVFALVGEAGVGKSVFAAQYVSKRSVDQQVLAYHFYDSKMKDSSPLACLQSLCKQFHSKLDDFEAGFDGSIPRENFGKWSMEEWFAKLLVEPLNEIKIQNCRFVVVIDALDECEGGEAFKKVVVDGWKFRMPPWISLLVTSRPSIINEPEDGGTPHGYTMVKIRNSMDLGVEKSAIENMKDIKLVLTDWLRDRFESGVTSVAFNSTGTQIVSGSADKTVRIWDVATGEQIGEPLTGHSDRVTSVAFNSTGTQFVSGSVDKTVRIWDVATGEQIGEPLTGHSEYVTSVAFNSTGTKIVSGYWDNTVRIWDVATGEQIGEPLTGHSSYVTSVAFNSTGTKIVSGSADTTIRIWDTDTSEQIGEPLTGHSDEVTSVAFNSTGTRIVSGSLDGTIRIWDTVTSDQIGEPFTGHSDEATSVVFNSTGTQVISGSLDGTIRIWDAVTNKKIAQPMTGQPCCVLGTELTSARRATSRKPELSTCSKLRGDVENLDVQEQSIRSTRRPRDLEDRTSKLLTRSFTLGLSHDTSKQSVSTLYSQEHANRFDLSKDDQGNPGGTEAFTKSSVLIVSSAPRAESEVVDNSAAHSTDQQSVSRNGTDSKALLKAIAPADSGEMKSASLHICDRGGCLDHKNDCMSVTTCQNVSCPSTLGEQGSDSSPRNQQTKGSFPRAESGMPTAQQKSSSDSCERGELLPCRSNVRREVVAIGPQTLLSLREAVADCVEKRFHSSDHKLAIEHACSAIGVSIDEAQTCAVSLIKGGNINSLQWTTRARALLFHAIEPDLSFWRLDSWFSFDRSKSSSTPVARASSGRRFWGEVSKTIQDPNVCSFPQRGIDATQCKITWWFVLHPLISTGDWTALEHRILEDMRKSHEAAIDFMALSENPATHTLCLEIAEKLPGRTLTQVAKVLRADKRTTVTTPDTKQN